MVATNHKLRPAAKAPEQWQTLREALEHVTAVKVAPTRPELDQAGDQTRSRRTGG
jgi:hypothetical protein